MVMLFDRPWMAALLGFVAVSLAVIVLAVLVELIASIRRRRGMTSRLERLDTDGLETKTPGAASIFRTSPVAESGWVKSLAARVPHLRDVEQLLQQADLKWTVQSYLVFVVGMGIAAGSAALVVTRSWPVFVSAAVGAAVPYFYLRQRRAARLRKFEEQFPEAIDLLGRAIRAGHPLSAALKMVAEEMPQPAAGEFRTVFEEQRFGLAFVDSLTAFADRVPLVDVRIFVTAVLIQREVGGNLTEILDNLSHIIRQRFTLQRQVKVLTAEGRFSVYVLSALPIGVAGFVLMSNREYLMTLVDRPVGRLMIWGALVMQVVGYMWMRRLTRIDY